MICHSNWDTLRILNNYTETTGMNRDCLDIGHSKGRYQHTWGHLLSCSAPLFLIPVD